MVEKPRLTSQRTIPLSAPLPTGDEAGYLREVLASSNWSGGGPFSQRCEAEMRRTLGTSHVLLTPSCTAALEMTTLLLRLGPGDEVIMPSFTFPSTANAVVLRGATPVFADIREDTLNLDVTKIEAAITPRTKAIIVVHYAGVCADMDAIAAVARRRGLAVIEDAAQAYLSTYRGRPAGALGDMGCFSFHETKNFGCGEGGAFVTNVEQTGSQAEILREKGTDRSRFLRGDIDKYSWVDIGSSYLPSEFTSAVLLAQLEHAAAITAKRLAVWMTYHEGLAELEARGVLTRPSVPTDCVHNAQIYRILLSSENERDAVMSALRRNGIGAAFHFVPLHLSTAGRRFARFDAENLTVTTSAAGRLLRLPLHGRMTPDDAEWVLEETRAAVRSGGRQLTAGN